MIKPSVMSAPELVSEADLVGGRMRFLDSRVKRVSADIFDPQNPDLNAEPVQVGGRQAAWFVSGPFGHAVLRHYRRGGLVAHLIHDRYFWMGYRRSRSFAEFDLLLFLRHYGVRVPLPIASACWHSSLFYQAAIMVERIPGARTLFQELDNGQHRLVAQAIFDMHRAGVFHADLNVYNILFDENRQVWLIDFDRSRRVSIRERHRRSNLLRLRRSLIKTAGTKGMTYWNKLSEAYFALLNQKTGL